MNTAECVGCSPTSSHVECNRQPASLHCALKWTTGPSKISPIWPVHVVRAPSSSEPQHGFFAPLSREHRLLAAFTMPPSACSLQNASPTPLPTMRKDAILSHVAQEQRLRRGVLIEQFFFHHFHFFFSQNEKKRWT